MRFKKTAVAVGTLALVTMAAPAWAAPYTVTVNGSSTAGSHAFSANSTSITFTVNNSGGDRVMTCNDVDISGSVTSGTNVGNPVATITSSTWGGCQYSGDPVDVTPDHSTAWGINGTGSATAGNTDTVAGNVSDVAAGVSVLGGACTFDVTGSANASIDEANQQVDVNETAGNLVVSNTSFFCFGEIDNFDTADFVGTFDFTPSIYLS